MALGDLYEARIEFDLNNEEQFNIFHFISNDVVSNAGDLALRIFNQWIAANWETLVQLGYSFIEIAVRNLFDNQDELIYPVGTTGTVIAEALPPHDSLSVQFANTDANIRNGSKRFGGLAENHQNKGVWDAGTITAWQTFLDGSITSPILGAGGSLAYNYVIVKRIKYTTPSGSTAYRLPENSGEAVYSIALTGNILPQVRTQISRDYRE